jgi:HK97 family phage portal protein
MSFLTRIFNPSYHKALEQAKNIHTSVADFPMGRKNYSNTYQSYSSSSSNNSPKASGDLIGMYNKQPLFRSIVNVIAEQIASTNFYIGTKKQGKDKPKAVKSNISSMPMVQKNKEIKRLKQEGLFTELPNHPLQVMLNAGNSLMTSFDIRKLTNIYLDIPGEAFLYICYKENTRVPEYLYPIPPNWISRLPTDKDPYYHTNSSIGSIHKEDMIWLKDINPANPYGRGVGAAFSLGDELDTVEYAADLMKVAFSNKGMPSALISLEDATEKEAERMQATWEQAFRGTGKYGLTKFTGSKIDVKQINRTFEELQLLPLRHDIRDTIRQLYGVPPEIVGILAESNRATIDAATYIMAKYVTIPRLERITRLYQKYLLNPIDDRLIIYYDDPTPDNRELQLEAAKTAPWSLTVNQWNTLSGYDGYGNQGEVRMVPINLVAVPVTKEKEPNLKNKAITKADEATLSKADINKIVNSLDPKLLSVPTSPIVRDCIGTFGETEYNNLLPDEKIIAKEFDRFDPTVQDYMVTYSSKRIVEINDTTKEAIRKSLNEGVAGGESQFELRNRITAVFNEGALAIDAVRAGRIAATEMNAAANFGHWEGMKQSGVVSRRKWIPTMIDTRTWHMVRPEADIDKPFDVDNEWLMYPGDSRGSAKNVINCACTTISLIDGKVPDETRIKEQTTVWLTSTKGWKDKYDKAITPGFKAQEKDCLKTFDEVI